MTTAHETQLLLMNFLRTADPHQVRLRTAAVQPPAPTPQVERRVEPAKYEQPSAD